MGNKTRYFNYNGKGYLKHNQHGNDYVVSN